MKTVITPHLTANQGHVSRETVSSHAHPATAPARRPDPFEGEGFASGDVAAFFADQGARARDITERSASLSSDGDIPEFLHTHSGSAADDLAKEVGGYIGAMKREHPELFQGNGGGGADVLSDWMAGEMSRKTEEEKKKFLEVLAAAKDPGSVILAITQEHSQESLQKVGRLMAVYREQMQSLDHLQAEFDLKQASGDLSQADMMKTNMEFARTQGDTMNLFQVIQKEMNNYERVMEGGQSIYKADNADQTMIQNMKG